MIIFIPSYKRTSLLPYVFESILGSDISGINERLVILIHNNYSPAKSEVDSIIKSFSDRNSGFEFMVVHREETMIPTDAWFDTILTTAFDTEAIFILGDDDLITPWGLRDRYREITSHNADLLLSNFVQRVYFFEGGQMCWPDMPELVPPPLNNKAKEWKFSTDKHENTTFISNHCYRNTQAFRDGLKRAFSWCSFQDWAPRMLTTGLIPSYLPYAIQLCGGKVVELSEFSVIRGSLFEEAVRQDFSDGGTVSFYALIALNTFSNTQIFSNIDRFEGLREIFLKSFRTGFLESLRSKSIKLKMIRLGVNATGLKWRDILGIELLNLRTVIRLFPFLRGWTLKKQAKNGDLLIPTRQFLADLKNK